MKNLLIVSILLLAISNIFAFTGREKELKMGVYIYDYAFRRTAAANGENLKDFVEKHFKILQQHRVNAIHLTVNRKDGMEFQEIWLPLMKKYGIKGYLQLDFAYFSYESTWNEKMENIRAKYAANFIEKFKNEPQIIAFSIREEVAHNQVHAMAYYYQKIKGLVPDFKYFIVHSGLGAAKDHPVPDPVIFGTDRYAFWWEFSGNGYLATPASALNWLRNEAANYQAEAAKRGADFLWVVTANAFVMGSDAPEKGWARSWKNPILREKILRYTREKRFGWNKDKVGKDEILWAWKWYLPPKNCTKAMIWTGILEGAKSILFWSYNPPADKMEANSPAEAISRRIARRPARHKGDISWVSMAGRPGIENTSLKEFAQTAEELAPYSKLICMMNKSPESPVITDKKKKIFNRAFTIPTYNGKIIVIHNANVGRWPGNKAVFGSNDNIKIDKNGNLEGYIPFKTPQKVDFKIKKQTQSEVFDWITGKKISLNHNSGTVNILPGSGTMLFMGSEKEFLRLKKTQDKI